jgi:uncharacterized protein (AIM24 family)
MLIYAWQKELLQGSNSFKKRGRGLFGVEGFIMGKMEEDGMRFVHAGGTMAKTVIVWINFTCRYRLLVGFSQDI